MRTAKIGPDLRLTLESGLNMLKRCSFGDSCGRKGDSCKKMCGLKNVRIRVEGRVRLEGLQITERGKSVKQHHFYYYQLFSLETTGTTDER